MRREPRPSLAARGQRESAERQPKSPPCGRERAIAPPSRRLLFTHRAPATPPRVGRILLRQPDPCLMFQADRRALTRGTITSGRSVISPSTPQSSKRLRVFGGVDRPDLDAKSGAMGIGDEPRRHHPSAAGPLRHLISVVRSAASPAIDTTSDRAPSEPLRAPRSWPSTAPARARRAATVRPNDPRQTRSTAPAARTTRTTA